MLENVRKKKEPKYQIGDKVVFDFGGEVRKGTIFVVDRYEEPTYDIEVKEGKAKGLYKHIEEMDIKGLFSEGV